MQNRIESVSHATMTGIFQNSIPHDIHAPRPLPGIAPLDAADWLQVDDAFAGQMAERARLLSQHRSNVLATTSGSQEAAEELFEFVLNWLTEHSPSYEITEQTVCRPDGVHITIDRNDPLGTLGHIVQEDFCLLDKRGDEHVLIAAVLCFPASWTLAEKIARPLTTIHVPVPEYDPGIARRVQRLFDGVHPDRPLCRYNVLYYADPTLHQPRSRDEPRARDEEGSYPYVRSERQSVLRLPKTRACVFSIHSYVMQRFEAPHEGKE